MLKLFSIVILASYLLCIDAKCDNACSGHGTCTTDDVCQCYDNFGSGLSHDTGDCSDRICPYEIAWVDNPNVLGQFHKYMECAGKGVCDRTTGECACFEGFEGKGCARAACPNACSGHGICDYIEDLTYGATWNDYTDMTSSTSQNVGSVSLFSDFAKTFPYTLWDKTKSRRCTCDATYGDLDCSKRLCPYGTDVLDTKDDTFYGLSEQKYQEQTILLASLSSSISDLASKSFALTFKSRLNETFTTIPIVIDLSIPGNFANDIKLALMTLPNGVIDGVSVVVDNNEGANSASINQINDLYNTGLSAGGSNPKDTVYFTQDGTARGNDGSWSASNPNHIKMSGQNRPLINVGSVSSASNNHRRLTLKAAAAYLTIKIRFTGSAVQGPQHLLIVEDYLCGDGCTPKLTGLPLETRQTQNIWSTIVEVTQSDYNSFECGRRGKCDYTTGLCQCFAGYIGDNCNTLTTLV